MCTACLYCTYKSALWQITIIAPGEIKENLLEKNSILWNKKISQQFLKLNPKLFHWKNCLIYLPHLRPISYFVNFVKWCAKHEKHSEIQPQFSRELYKIFKRISHNIFKRYSCNFEENITQFCREFYVTFKIISCNF